MPDLNFKVTGVQPATRGLTPLLNFQVKITNQPATEEIYSVLLQAEVQIQTPQRNYNAREKEKLLESFGRHAQWGHTLRDRLWTMSRANASAFAGSTIVQLPVMCSDDLNIAATKYCYALEQGNVPLLFLFSGTVFHAPPGGHLRVQQISWSKEATYQMPVRVWREIMDEHFPNSAWLHLNRDAFDRLYAYKRSHGLATWEQTIAQLLLPAAERNEVLA